MFNRKYYKFFDPILDKFEFKNELENDNDISDSEF